MTTCSEKIGNAIDKVACCRRCLQVTKIRDTRENEQNLRVVFLNNQQPHGYNGDQPLKYAGNEIKTSKYNLITFLPKNLFEQFRRIANFYFLVNIIITLVTPDPPTSPYTSIIPLALVVIVTAIKQGYEDVLRHLSDAEINKTKVRVIRNGEFIEIIWSQIVCGDIVEVLHDGTFPCDLILLYAETEDNTCHITTANLDGESNLKVRRLPNGIKPFKNPLELSTLNGAIVFDKPNRNLYEFKGKLIMNGVERPLVNDNVLLRGTRLKIANVIYGCAIYTGKDTKVMLNSKFKSNKLSCVEKRLNLFILIFLVVLALMTVFSFGLSFMYNNYYTIHWYLSGTQSSYYSNTNLYEFIVFVFYMNLYNYIIPLSMYVTVELQRFIGSQFIQWDDKMYDEKLDETAKANNSDINEDLGQIEYLFSDKTGTLTENEMIFKQCAIDGVVYEERNGNLFNTTNNQLAQLQNEKLLRFLEIMVVCHTVNVDESNPTEKFQASSPDEFSFLKFCEKFGISYLGEKKDPNSQKLIRTVKFFQEIRQYELLHLFEFDSKRKRMSVILRYLKTNEIILYTKGAEDSIFSCCTSGNIQQCNNNISEFAKLGWRTLAFAFRILSQPEFSQYDRLLLDAYNDVTLREEKMIKAFKTIESGLTLVGATGIEDRLQEDCGKTLEALRQAGIKVWVLTGDKKETALNISYSCKHFSNDMILFNLTDLKRDEIEKKLKEYKNRLEKIEGNQKFSLVVDGKTLVDVMDYYSEPFLDICLLCEAVLCCRMSPGQKADIVRLVKLSKTKPMTAAVGDGANDVSMIQEAHVGIGIYGKEGRNAARSADFAFAKFKYLQRIILVHGYLYYTRSAYLINYFFYKNLAFVTCQFYYSFFNAFSIQTLFNSIILTFYNITFTSAPIFFYGIFEQRVSMKFLEKSQYLYQFITRNKTLSYFEFFKWNMFGLYHSIIAFFFPFGLYFTTSHFHPDGKISGFSEFGSIVITIIFIVVHVKLFIETHNYNWVFIVGVLLSIFSYFFFLILPNSFIMPSILTSFTDNQDLYWVYYDMFSQITVWFCMVSACIAAIIPDIISKVIDTLLERNKVNKLRELEEDRLYKLEYPGYPEHPTREMLNMKKALYKRNQISDSGMDNKTFVGDSNGANTVDPKSGTIVYTDPNFRYNNLRNYGQRFPQYFNPYVYNWSDKNLPINSFSKTPEINSISIFPFQQINPSQVKFIFNQTQYRNSYNNNNFQQINKFKKPLKTNLSIPIQFQQQLITTTPQSFVQFRPAYMRINRNNWNPFL